MQKRTRFFWGFWLAALAFPSCAHNATAPAASESGPNWADEWGYFSAIEKQRPDLLADIRACAAALSLRSDLRVPLLEGKDAPWKRERETYSAEMRERDRIWIHAHRDAVRSFGARLLGKPAQIDPLNEEAQGAFAKAELAPAPYHIDTFVGYRIGAPASMTDENGLGYKVYLEFADITKDLPPERLHALAEFLRKEGFQGDIRVPTNEGRSAVLHFDDNHFILQASQPAMAAKGEAALLRFFAGGNEIRHYSRGVDVQHRADGRTIVGLKMRYDWHHFLCTGRFSLLPKAAQDFALRH